MTNSVPSQLEAWVRGRVDLIAARLRTAQRAQHGTDDVHAWILDIVRAATEIQNASEQLVHLLTAYGLRSGVVTQTEIARASHVTVTGATNRALGRVARAAWREIWPESQGEPSRR